MAALLGVPESELGDYVGEGRQLGFDGIKAKAETVPGITLFDGNEQDVEDSLRRSRVRATPPLALAGSRRGSP